MGESLDVPLNVAFVVSVDLSGGGLRDLQREVRREARRALGIAFRNALARIETALIANRVLCRACGGAMQNRGRSTRRIVSVFGPIDVPRIRYRCRQCGATRRPLDDWLRLNTDVTAMVREQALYLAADLPYERAADVLRRVGGIGISGRQIQRLLEIESDRIAAALGHPEAGRGDLQRRFRRAGKNSAPSVGARRLLQLRRLRSSGLWDAYWSGRLDGDAEQTPKPERRKGAGVRR